MERETPFLIACATLTLWFDKEEAIFTTVLKLKNDFVWNLVTQKISFDDILYIFVLKA